VSAFGDAAEAWCTPEEQSRSLTCRNATAAVRPLVSVGTELVLDAGVGGLFAGRIRAGVGVPIHGSAFGREDDLGPHPRFYITLGSNY
jgi:hypothetical protein